jgi:hypothetical protein
MGGNFMATFIGKYMPADLILKLPFYIILYSDA